MALSRRGLILLAVLAIMGIANLWANLGSLDLIWRIALAMTIIAIVTERVLLHRYPIASHATTPPTLLLGRQQLISLELKSANPVPLRIDLLTHVDGLDISPKRIVATLEPVRGAQVDLNVTATTLGNQTIGTLKAFGCGRFGLSWWRVKLEVNKELRVAPDTLDISTVRTSSAALGDTTQPVIGSGGDLLGLRPYTPGDSLRHIDWKATARCGEHIVREFSEDQHLEIMIALDVGRSSQIQVSAMNRLGHYANAAARLAQLAIVNDDRVGLIVFADRPLMTLTPQRGAAAVIRIRQALSQIAPVPAESNVLSAMLTTHQRLRQRSLVVIFSDLDDPGARAQLRQGATLLLPRHLPLITAIRDPDQSRLSKAPAANWLDACTSLAASDAERREHAVARHLTSAGCRIVREFPQSIDHALLDMYRRLRLQRRI